MIDTKPHGLGVDGQVESVLSAIDNLGIATASQNVVARSFGSRASRELVEWAKCERCYRVTDLELECLV